MAIGAILKRTFPSVAAGVFTVTAAAVTLICVSAWVLTIYRMLHDPNHGGEAVDIDFSVFWAAAKLAAGGDWLAPFDPVILNEARSLPPDHVGSQMIWFYPPAYLLLTYPLGLMSFFWAWFSFCAISFLMLLIAAWPPTRNFLAGRVLLVCAPAMLIVLALGQNSLFTLALLIGTIEAMRRERFVLAGLLIAALTLKPQLGLAIPVILLAGSYWRVILWACIGTAVIVAGTMIFPGPDYWVAFFHGLQAGGSVIHGSDLVRLMITAYGTAATLGASPDIALGIQGVVSLVSALALAWLWRNPSIDFDLKAGGLCLGILLITPYLIHYELVYGVAAAFYLARAGFGAQGGLRYLVALLWLAPAIGYVQLPWPGYAFVSPLLILTFVAVLAVSQSPLAKSRAEPA